MINCLDVLEHSKKYRVNHHVAWIQCVELLPCYLLAIKRANRIQLNLFFGNELADFETAPDGRFRFITWSTPANPSTINSFWAIKFLFNFFEFAISLVWKLISESVTMIRSLLDDRPTTYNIIWRIFFVIFECGWLSAKTQEFSPSPTAGIVFQACVGFNCLRSMKGDPLISFKTLEVRLFFLFPEISFDFILMSDFCDVVFPSEGKSSS